MMGLTLAALMLLSLWGMRICKDGIRSSYLGRDSTDAVNGIFIFVVFLGHARGYLLNAGYEYDMGGVTLFSKSSSVSLGS